MVVIIGILWIEHDLQNQRKIISKECTGSFYMVWRIFLMKNNCWCSGVMFKQRIQPHLDNIFWSVLKIILYYRIRLYVMNITHHKYLIQVNLSIMLNSGINFRIIIYGIEDKMSI